MPTKEELEYNLINRNIRMSYSKLKNLTSPVNFMNALLEPKTKNAGMIEGSFKSAGRHRISFILFPAGRIVICLKSAAAYPG